MKGQTNTTTFDISALIKKIEENEGDFEKKCLQYDLKQERLMVNFYKEFVKNMMRYELDHCWL